MVVFIDMHTLETTVEEGQTCTSCHRMLRLSAFYHRARKCKPCYEKYWMSKQDMAAKLPHEMHIDKAVYRANRRARFRQSHGNQLTYQEALSKWTGTCHNCQVALNFNWHPRNINENLAIIDRVDTQHNASYANNMQWLCHACNTEKGGWDLAKQLGADIDRLKQQLKKKKKKRKRTLMYADILMPHIKQANFVL